MIGGQPAIRAEFSAAVLAGEGEHHFVSAMVAPGHYCSVGYTNIKNSAPGGPGKHPGTVILILKRD